MSREHLQNTKDLYVQEQRESNKQLIKDSVSEVFKKPPYPWIQAVQNGVIVPFFYRAVEYLSAVYEFGMLSSEQTRSLDSGEVINPVKNNVLQLLRPLDNQNNESIFELTKKTAQQALDLRKKA